VAISAGDLSPNVLVSSDDPVLLHAAAELRDHLASQSGGSQTIPVRLEAVSAGGDGFEIHARADGVRIDGDSSRGVLNGVYWLLEQLGWLWVKPGGDGTRFRAGQTLEEGVYRETPLFPRRTLILGNDALHDQWPDWLEFASRNRCNSIFFHDTPPSVLGRGGAQRPADADGIAADGKGWLFERWDQEGGHILAECGRRAMTVQFGGHHLPALLRRELFDEHPDWFPERHGERDRRYNLCTSSAGARAEVLARARDFFDRFRGAHVYHLWADDIRGGGWCECASCAGFSPSDQALRATNVLAGALAATAPEACIAHLAYHDTIAPPSAEQPAANVSALYAPRNRSYAFAIDEPGCERNREHLAELHGLARTFAGRPQALAAFEYYSDAILFRWLAPPHLAILPVDASAYAQAGVYDFGNLAVTPRPWLGPNWHAWWFARCAWERQPDADAELQRFCEASFGADGERFAASYRALDGGYRGFLDLGDLTAIPRHDVLDFSDTPREALGRKAAQMREALQALDAAAAPVPLVPAGLGAGLRHDLAAQLASAHHIGERILAWDAALDGRTDERDAHAAAARDYLRALADWDRVHGSPGYANLSRGMFRSAEWHTTQIVG
jgi:hypothetical protein